MSPAEVQNIREHQMKRARELDAEALKLLSRAARMPEGMACNAAVKLAADLSARAHLIRVQLDLEDSTKRYQEQTK